MTDVVSIPEMLGFAAIAHGRKKLFDQVSYQAQYILYEDEAQDLVRRYAGSENPHKELDLELSLRFARDREYRNRVVGWDDDPEVRATFGIGEHPIGGYVLMERRMQKAGVIPEDEAAIKRQMNRLLGDIGEPGIDE